MPNGNRGPVAGNDGPHSVTGLDESVVRDTPKVNSPWLTQRELAARLRVSVSTVLRMRPPSHRVGCVPRYHRDEVDAWLMTRGAR